MCLAQNTLLLVSYYAGFGGGAGGVLVRDTEMEFIWRVCVQVEVERNTPHAGVGKLKRLLRKSEKNILGPRMHTDEHG
jgi:hypothetical protein